VTVTYIDICKLLLLTSISDPSRLGSSQLKGIESSIRRDYAMPPWSYRRSRRSPPPEEQPLQRYTMLDEGKLIPVQNWLTFCSIPWTAITPGVLLTEAPPYRSQFPRAPQPYIILPGQVGSLRTAPALTSVLFILPFRPRTRGRSRLSGSAWLSFDADYLLDT
jgi:hypothetical protein